MIATSEMTNTSDMERTDVAIKNFTEFLFIANIEYAMQRSRSSDAVIRVTDAAGKVIGTRQHGGDCREF